MAGKTLYDVLEISSSASAETIRGAYERLSAQLDPRKPENAGNSNVKFVHDSVKEAFLTLGNPTLRAQYDKKLAMRALPPVQVVEVSEVFWTVPKLATLVLIVIIAGGFYWKHKREEARLAAEQAIAASKAKEAEEKAKAEAEQARLEVAKQLVNAAQDEQQRRDREQAIRQYSIDQRVNASATQARAQQDRSAELQRQREEQQAASAARAQAARDKAELCRMERARYGKAISC
jgi:curved DNA-binding protein CbpA